ncbi:hypothetical protein RAZWK3B_16978, partial [Roseobacter sp. AzwK-3b]
MAMGKDVENDRFGRLRFYSIQRLGEQVDKLPWSATEAHGMGQIVEF